MTTFVDELGQDLDLKTSGDCRRLLRLLNRIRAVPFVLALGCGFAPTESSREHRRSRLSESASPRERRETPPVSSLSFRHMHTVWKPSVVVASVTTCHRTCGTWV